MDEGIIATVVELWNSDPSIKGSIDKSIVCKFIEAWPKLDCIGIMVAKDLATNTLPTNSYLGGAPALPKHVSWPQTNHPRLGKRSMVFIGQVNCEDLRSCSSQLAFPSDGMLFFFVGWDIEEGLLCPSCRVIYTDLEPVTSARNTPDDILTLRQAGQEYGGTFMPRPGDDDIRLHPKRLMKLAVHKSMLDGPLNAHFFGSEALAAQKIQCRFESGLLDYLASFRTDFQISSKAKSFGLIDRTWGLTCFGDFDSEDPFIAQYQIGGFPRGPHSVGVNGADSEGRILLAQFESQRAMDWNWNDYLTFWISPEELAQKEFGGVVAKQSKGS